MSRDDFIDDVDDIITVVEVYERATGSQIIFT